jgi:ADP-ribosylglycohydrolase
MLCGMTRVTAEQIATARGCVLGLVLGDAIGAAGGEPPADGTLRVTSASQLACFTIDGIIRGHLRDAHKGNTHPRGMVWHAYARWATMQGIPAVKKWQDDGWPDGWLAEVSALAARRGSAPATVAALQGCVMGTVEEPVGVSVGAHAITRSLPAGLCDWWGSPPGPFAADVAATTHAREAMDVAAIGATVVANLGKGQGIERAVQEAQRECAAHSPGAGSLPLGAALAAGQSDAGNPVELTRLAPDARAISALTGAVYVAASFPHRRQLRQALQFAASTPAGRHVTPVTGAFLGTAHGVDALPVDLVSRLELAWVADTLARDLIRQFVDGPGGTGYTSPSDPHWWDRYPGW